MLIEEKWLIDIPLFLPDYKDDVEYGYKNKPGENLEALLREKSRNHCMYCYCLLKSDRVNTGHLEHSIEKALDKDLLSECVPNISIACSNCNLSLKRNGEKQRLKELQDVRTEFRSKAECTGKKCKVECEAYKELKDEYCKVSQIILQPFGVKGKNGTDYRIQYDIYNAEFIPSKDFDYSDEDINYIRHHINQFRLNDTGFKTKALADFVEDVVNSCGRYVDSREYSNYIVDLFKEKIKDMDRKEILELCQKIYTRNFLLFRN